MILPGIAFAAIAAILAGSALLSKTGQRMDVESENFSNCADTNATAEICGRKAPKIICAGKKIWAIGETIPIETLFLATDADGNQIRVDVEDITDADGNSAMGNYREASQEALFQNRGVYTFHLKTMDSERKTATQKISVVVDGR